MVTEAIRTIIDELLAFGNILTKFVTRSVWDFLMLDNFDGMISDGLAEWFQSTSMLSIFIGAGFIFFAIYTLVKWILDIVL